MDGYRRPPLELGEFRDADGGVIPYGSRWSGLPPDETYSVTAHPERFAPLVSVSRALADAVPLAHRPGGDALPITFEVTKFPGVIVRVGPAEFPFPSCGCDACDDAVEDLVEQMEQLVEAVVGGRFEVDGSGRRYRYEGDWGSRGVP